METWLKLHLTGDLCSWAVCLLQTPRAENCGVFVLTDAALMYLLNDLELLLQQILPVGLFDLLFYLRTKRQMNDRGP